MKDKKEDLKREITKLITRFNQPNLHKICYHLNNALTELNKLLKEKPALTTLPEVEEKEKFGEKQTKEFQEKAQNNYKNWLKNIKKGSQ